MTNKSKMKLKQNDNVIILAGRDKGKSGLVSAVFRAENKIVVAGRNIYKKSVKPSKKSPKGGIIEINAKISASNVAIICPSCNKPTKVGYQTNKEEKIRVCRKCKGAIIFPETKA
ncbi:MAG: 50S ribosomal protein L24 [Candidatus Berkelbacteria bacterium]|nr:50S ribosomal protein L24 [Candidatus Berkelbacteria bacterium]